MNMEQALRAAVAAQTLRHLDLHFALALRPFTVAQSESAMLAGALVSARTGTGHVCVALDEFAGTMLFGSELYRGIEAPDLDAWRAALLASGVVGKPGDFMPLLLDSADRLYLARYFQFERTIAVHLRARAETPLTALDHAAVRTRLDIHFPPTPELDHQRLAAAAALLRPLTVIAGGPGTGKTTTVTRLLAVLIEHSWPQVPRIALTAPTGKAAARLSESIKAQKARLACRDEIRAALPDEAYTLHRLLRAVPGRTEFRHDASNPLHLDLLVVDEVSMVDVPTMARLLEALPATARLILLGDPDQLASVEAGSVLSDICNRDHPGGYSAPFRAALAQLGTTVPDEPVAPSPMGDSRVMLQVSRRFGPESTIGQLARAINSGEEAEVTALLAAATGHRVWREVDEAALIAAVIETGLHAYASCFDAGDAADALAAYNRFRFLCALRDGPFGNKAINRMVEQALRKHGVIAGGERFYKGRPIMITRNDYALGLFNGDVGVVWPDSEGHLRAYFMSPDGAMKRVVLTRLPEHDTVFAMTIHKSQGSEFDQCVVVLPDRDVPLLTRELVYTAVTRARQAVEIWGAQTALAAALTRRTTRRSGLGEALWNPTTAQAWYPSKEARDSIRSALT